MVSQGVSMLWSSFIPAKKAQERLGMRMSDLVEHVSKKPIPAWTKNLLVEVMVNDEDDEDVEVGLEVHWQLSTDSLTSGAICSCAHLGI